MREFQKGMGVPGALTIVATDANATSLRYSNIVIQIWHAETTLEGVAAFRKTVSAAAQDAPGRLRVLVVVEQGSALPAKVTRSKIAAVMTDYRAQVQAAALAYEGTGFGAASIRAVVTGLNLLAQHPFPYRVFASIPEALSWECMTDGEAPSSLHVARAIRQFRDGRVRVAS